MCVEFVSSDFMQETLKIGEMETLQSIFQREQKEATNTPPFNVIVDLCGVFKLTNIYDVRTLVLKHFGLDCFHYIYHIDQTDGSDRMLCIRTNNDVAFDEEFYKHLCRTYGASLSAKIFFFVDNRNYIGMRSKCLSFSAFYSSCSLFLSTLKAKIFRTNLDTSDSSTFPCLLKA